MIHVEMYRCGKNLVTFIEKGGVTTVSVGTMDNLTPDERSFIFSQRLSELPLEKRKRIKAAASHSRPCMCNDCEEFLALIPPVNWDGAI